VCLQVELCTGSLWHPPLHPRNYNTVQYLLSFIINVFMFLCSPSVLTVTMILIILNPVPTSLFQGHGVIMREVVSIYCMLDNQAWPSEQHNISPLTDKRTQKLEETITRERASSCCQSSQQYAPVLRNIHRVHRGFTSCRRRRELAPNLRPDLRVRVYPHDITQPVLLLRREVSCIALAEHQQTLVPEHGECARCVGVPKSNEMEDERVKDLVWQCVLLV
jgi:hypothetical protein